MLKFHIDIKEKRNFLKAGKRVSLKITFTCLDKSKQIPITNFLEKLLCNELTPLAAINGVHLKSVSTTPKDLSNLRGRPQESFLHRKFTDIFTEELFFAAGDISIPTESENNSPGEPSTPQTDKFNLRIRSEFKEFSDKETIVYEISPTISFESGNHLHPNLQGISINSLFSSDYISLNNARIGWETFKSSYLGSRIGLAPSISSRMYSEYNTEKINLFTQEESLKRREDLLATASGAFLQAFDKSLSDSHLYEGFIHEVQDKLIG